MVGSPKGFWGKLELADAVIAWHPLRDHCADVAAVAEQLLCLPVWRRRLSRLAGHDLSTTCVARLCVLVALHDIGKFNLGFQSKARGDHASARGHVKEALGALAMQAEAFASVVGLVAPWGDEVEPLLVASICHHGRPYAPNEASTVFQQSWWRPGDGLDPTEGLWELCGLCRKWFPDAFSQGGRSLPSAPEFSHAFAGLVMLADWIGSDKRFFPFSDSADLDRMIDARTSARAAVESLGLAIPLDLRKDSTGRSPFERIANGRIPRPAQEALIALPAVEEGSITILEAETGSGKTEAVLGRFLVLFEKGLVDSLYFALPTRTAATEMHSRVFKAMQQGLSEPPAVTLGVPGYFRVDDVDGHRNALARFEVLWPDDDTRFRFRAWAAESTKRYLTGAVTVGTVDQVLLSALMVGHSHLRALSLLRSLLVVDEVHASDAYMTRILEEVLGRHVSAGGHAVLLSATLGGEARTRLLSPNKPAEPPPFDVATKVAYPLISQVGVGTTYVRVPSHGRRRDIKIVEQPWMDGPESVARCALGAAEKGAKVLVIRNTVRDCVATQLAIEQLSAGTRSDVLFTCDSVPAPHHARFARDDRQKLDVALAYHFGPRRGDGGCVAVATQTVQQSLDVDADLLLSDLCPIDVLLQRLGRLHRHALARPNGVEVPVAYILVPSSRDLGVLISERGSVRGYHGLGLVYDDLRIIEATWRMVQRYPEWKIPDMNRQLVENGVHSAVLQRITATGGARWQAHEAQVLGQAAADRRLADLNAVDWSETYGQRGFPDKTDQRISTRLGEGDRRVVFPRPFRSPFGSFVPELTLPEFWMRGVEPDLFQAEELVVLDGGTEFSLGGRRFKYDRLGLRPMATS